MESFKQHFFSGFIKRKYQWLLSLIVVVWFIFLFLSEIWHPMVLRIDGTDPICYYSYLHSVIFDHDFHFANEYNYMSDILMENVDIAPNGYPTNSFAIGPAVLAAPFYVATHLLLKTALALGFTGIAADGLSYPYQFSFFLLLPLLGALGLIYLFKSLCLFFNEKYSLAAVLLILFSTNLIYYFFPVTLMPHSISFCSTSLLVYYCLKNREKLCRIDLPAILTAAVFVGFTVLIRWQDVIFAILPAMIIINGFSQIQDRRKKALKLITAGVLSMLIVFIIFIPQMLSWKAITGSYLTIPQGKSFLQLGRPALIKILFSTYNGLLTWHPVIIICLTGMVLFHKKNNVIANSFIMIFLFQYYLNASVKDWHGSWGFGMRRFVNCIPLFAFGLAEILNRTEKLKTKFSFVMLGFSLFTIWNLLFLFQFYYELIPDYRPLNYYEFVEQKFILKRASSRKFLTNGLRKLVSMKKFERVDELSELIMNLDPKSIDSVATCAVAYFDKGNYAASFKFYKMAGYIEPERGEWTFGAALSLLRMGNYNQAKYFLVNTIRLNKERVEESKKLLEKIDGR